MLLGWRMDTNTLLKRTAALLLAAFLLAAMLPVSALEPEAKEVYTPSAERQTEEEPVAEDDAAEAELETADEPESADVTVSETVDEVIELLTRIDSLQAMQD